MRNIILIIGLFLFTLGITGQTKSQKKIEKEIKYTESYSKTKTVINSKTFVFEPNWVNPMGGSNININGDGYYLKIYNDSIDVDLPYFGRVYSSVNFGTGGGIEIKGLIKDYEVSHNDKKRKSIITLSTKNDSEYFDIRISIFRSGSSTLTITGRDRNSISYNGNIIKPTGELI